MKKHIIFTLLISLFGFQNTFASKTIETEKIPEDTAIVDEVDKKNTQKFEDFRLKTFESCEKTNEAMEKYLKLYRKHHKKQLFGRGKFDNFEMADMAVASIDKRLSIAPDMK